MLEKIKKLLDSGCEVWVEYQRIDPVYQEEYIIQEICYGVNPDGCIVFGMRRLYEGDNGATVIRDSTRTRKIEILSIKPIARPLYNYKVGDRVVVLDNYPAEDFIGKVGIIETVGVGLVAVDFKESNSLGAMLDIRCIAPVLD